MDLDRVSIPLGGGVFPLGYSSFRRSWITGKRDSHHHAICFSSVESHFIQNLFSYYTLIFYPVFNVRFEVGTLDLFRNLYKNAVLIRLGLMSLIL